MSPEGKTGVTIDGAEQAPADCLIDAAGQIAEVPVMFVELSQFGDTACTELPHMLVLPAMVMALGLLELAVRPQLFILRVAAPLIFRSVPLVPVRQVQVWLGTPPAATAVALTVMVEKPEWKLPRKSVLTGI